MCFHYGNFVQLWLSSTSNIWFQILCRFRWIQFFVVVSANLFIWLSSLSRDLSSWDGKNFRFELNQSIIRQCFTDINTVRVIKVDEKVATIWTESIWKNIENDQIYKKYIDVHVKILHDFRWKFASVENQSAECLRGFIVSSFDSIHISQATAMRLSYNKIHSDGTDFGKLLKPPNFVIWKCTFTWSKIPPRIPLVDSLRMNRSGIAIVQEMYNGGHFITIYHFATVKSTFMLNQYEIAQV